MGPLQVNMIINGLAFQGMYIISFKNERIEKFEKLNLSTKANSKGKQYFV